MKKWAPFKKCMVRLGTVCVLAAFLTGFLSACTGEVPEDILQEIKYYSVLELALDDAQAAVTEHSDGSEENAVAAIRIYESGKREVLLLKDAALTKDYSIFKGTFFINFDGHVLSTHNAQLSIWDGNITVDGKGGKLDVTGDGDATGLLVNGTSNTQVTVCDLNIFVSGKDAVYGVLSKQQDTTLTLNNCNVKVLSLATEETGTTRALSSAAGNRVTVNGGSYVADGLYQIMAANNANEPVAIMNSGVMTLNGVSACGIHSGVSNHGIMTVTGGYLCSPTHGGMYNSNVLYMQDATVECCKYTGECTSSFEHMDIIRLGAMYNGSTARNAKAYIDNCTFIKNGGINDLVVSQNYGYRSGEVYISNCHIGFLRVDGLSDSGQIGTVYAGENFSYDFKAGSGRINTSTYEKTAFNTDWLKEQGICK